jgi:hypothetical protein
MAGLPNILLYTAVAGNNSRRTALVMHTPEINSHSLFFNSILSESFCNYKKVDM